SNGTLLKDVINEGGSPQYKYFYPNDQGIVKSMEAVLKRLEVQDQADTENVKAELDCCLSLDFLKEDFNKQSIRKENHRFLRLIYWKKMMNFFQNINLRLDEGNRKPQQQRGCPKPEGLYRSD
ncbi:unnamed protein product, partial [Allacma fusca]